MTAAASLAKASFDAPTETRSFPDGRLELVDLGDAVIGRFVLEPGWRWSRCVRPTAGTATCRQPHLGYVLAGRMHVAMDDGAAGEAGPGEVFRIDPGHDAWTVGDETTVLLDFAGAGDYATASR
ncbi:MAG: cupin domain-containing protein [Pseudonocardia sp.]|nr:cupin domain-containing protein [Pseudonocardia sp.]